MNDKALVAYHAAQKIKNGMTIGLGTGSTANYFIEALAQRHQHENLHVHVVASSVVSTIKAQQLGLPLCAIEHLNQLDVYVDGADEVTPDLTLLKGRGADLVREKILAEAAEQFWVLIDQSKWVNHLGERYPIPIEVMPFAWQLVKQRLEQYNAIGELRKNASGDGLAVTSHGSLVLDTQFDSSMTGQTLNQLLNHTAGIVEHGVFYQLTNAVFCAVDGKVQEQWTSH